MLTEKQQFFVKEYLVDFNALQAAIRAGYSAKTAGAAGHRLLRHVEVAAQIDQEITKRKDKLNITADYVIRTIRDTVERCSQSEQVLDAKGRPTGEYKFDSFAVLKGAELLGKHLKLFTDKVEHSGQIEQVDFSRLSDTQLEEIQRIVDSADQPK